MARQTYGVTRPDQLKALASPIRHGIVDRLAAHGPLSVRDLAAAVGERPTAIYRHLATLEKVGLIEASAVASARGRPAMIYRAGARRGRVAKAPAGHRPMAKISGVLARNAAREYAAGFKSAGRVPAGSKRNHWFFETLSAPSPKRLARINALLEELAELLWQPDPRPGPLIRLTVFVSPSSGRSTHRGKP